MSTHDEINREFNEIVYGEGGKRPATMPFNTTDYGNAERLVARHGENLRYVHAWGRWFQYDGTRWRVDDTGEVVRRAKETARSIYGEAERPEYAEIRKTLARHAIKSEAQERIKSMIALAQSEPGIPVRPDDFDADPWLFNVENGTVDLRTGELQEHRREDSITKLAPVAYDPDAKAPEWEAFLEHVLPSPALRTFLQQAVGYALTGDVSEQVLIFLHGSGANGKSTLINTIRRVLGEYGQQAAPELLEAKRGAHPTELADLKGARFVSSVEAEDGKRLAENLVKQMTGGDAIKARFMRQDFFEFWPTHKTFLATNHKPEIKGTDYAIWRRIKMVPFEVTIPLEEQDTKLPEKLKAELPGILAWAVRGCLDWQENGLGEPEEVREATESYRAEMDVLAGFIEERCIVKQGAWAKFADLYAEYEKWCQQSGETAEKKRTFGTRLKERGFAPDKGTDNVSIRRGIALRSDREPPDGGEGPEKNLENYPITDNYPNSGMTVENDSPVGLTPNQGNCGYLGNSSDARAKRLSSDDLAGDEAEEAECPVRALLECSPSWLSTQLERCRQDAGLIKPTCSTIAYQVYGTASRWKDVLPAVEAKLREAHRE